MSFLSGTLNDNCTEKKHHKRWPVMGISQEMKNGLWLSFQLTNMTAG